MLYLAGVFQGKVVLVGKDDCRALSLADGNKQLWRVETGPPCGVGVASSTSYYLPLATGELCTIDLTGGRISARTSSPNKEPLGNILIHDGVLISQTPTEVVCYGPKKEKPKK